MKMCHTSQSDEPEYLLVMGCITNQLIVSWCVTSSPNPSGRVHHDPKHLSSKLKFTFHLEGIGSFRLLLWIVLSLPLVSSSKFDFLPLVAQYLAAEMYLHGHDYVLTSGSVCNLHAASPLSTCEMVE